MQHRPRLPLVQVLVFALAIAALPSGVSAQVTYPKAPESYDVHLRYSIKAGRDERIVQYRAMTAFFKKIGFVPVERDDADLDIFDPIADRFAGTIPSANAAKLLDDPRVRTVLLIPTGAQLPPEAANPVQIRIQLSKGLSLAEQQQLHTQSVAQLQKMGFTEFVGYDPVGYTLVRGSFPVGNLMKLLRDLRYQPGGWFLPEEPVDLLPLPLRHVQAIRVIEVIADLPEGSIPPPPAPLTPLPADIPIPSPAALAKMTEELKAVVYDPELQGKPLRLELIFDVEPLGGLKDFEVTLRGATAGANPDGLIGVVGSARVLYATDVLKIAELPEVKALRLPRAGTDTSRKVDFNTMGAVPVAQVLTESRTTNLHQIGFRGQGIRIVIVGQGFPGALGMIGKQLPKSTKVIDLTEELSPSLSPAPDTAPNAGGTSAALAALAAAPDAELTLIRIDPGAFHQLLTVAKAVSGDKSYSIAMQVRSTELIRKSDELVARRSAVIEEYRKAFSDLSDEDTPRRRRDAARGALTELYRDEKAFKGAVDRFAALRAALDGLSGAGIVVNTMVWDSGFPDDGLSVVSQYLDLKFVPNPTRSAIRASLQPPPPSWVQAASGSVGLVWSGSFLDTDNNGAMEFAPTAFPIPATRWTRELNFLRFAPTDGDSTTTLPAGLKVRITVQWREPHELDDEYRPQPIYPMKLRVLRQADPEGKVAATDDMIEVARSVGPTIRLLKTPGCGVYELSMLLTVPSDGVYALRVERGESAELFPQVGRRDADLRPRIVIQLADADTAKGKAVFDTFVPRMVGVGIPGEVPAVLTIGSGTGPAYRTPTCLTGAGPGITLRTKPDFFTAGILAIGEEGGAGPGVSAGFAGGVAASALSTGLRARAMTRTLQMDAGGPLILPAEWLSTLRLPTRTGER